MPFLLKPRGYTSQERQSSNACASVSLSSAFDEKQQEKRKAIERRPIFSKPTASCTLTPTSDGSLSRRAEIKRKLGLHLTSPKVELALNSPTIKGLVKKNVSRTVQSSTRSENPASLGPELRTLKPSQSGDVKAKGETDTQEQDVQVGDASEVCTDGQTLLALDGTSDDKHTSMAESGDGADLSVSVDTVEHPGNDNASGDLKGSKPANVDSSSLNTSSNFNSSAASESVSKHELCAEKETTGLAVLMASYDDSDTNSSDAAEN